MPYIYILHFHTPLSHAEHYAGSCVDLKRRLTQHATGAGSRICRELLDRKIPWTLGALAQVNHAKLRQIERHLKEIKNTPRYCEICSAEPARIDGTMPYPISQIPWKTNSTALSNGQNVFTDLQVRFTTPDEHATTIIAIRDLMRKDADRLGFIPAAGGQGLTTLAHQGLIAVAHIENTLAGYAAFSQSHDRTRTTIHQCCVADSHRLQGIGRALVNFVSWSKPNAPTIAKVRDDLAANEFWKSIGFVRQRTITHRTSKNAIHHYLRPPIAAPATVQTVQNAESE